MNIMMENRVIEKIGKKRNGYYVGCVIKGFEVIGETRVFHNNGKTNNKAYVLKCLNCGAEFTEITEKINSLSHEELCPMEYYGYDPKGEWVNKRYLTHSMHLKRDMGNGNRDKIGVDKKDGVRYRAHIYVVYDKSVCDKKTNFVHLIYTKSEDAAKYAYEVGEEIVANETRQYGKVISTPPMIRREVKNRVYKKFPDELL